MQRKNNSEAGFTLVEILIVVIILGILAAIVIPQFSSASIESRENMVRENLRVIRAQINVYRAQHQDIPPGCDVDGNVSEELFVAQMTEPTDEYGQPGNTYGPYLTKIPENSVNHLSSVNIVDELPEEAPGGSGWIYHPDDIFFSADLPGQDSSGRNYYNY
jgi:general secretion pathway protein G